MSSAHVEPPPPPPTKTHGTRSQHTRNSISNAPHLPKTSYNDKCKRKFKHDRTGRKRSKSFSGCSLGKLLNAKPVLPSKFLLGGNIRDPLNLNSLQDEEINRAMNAITPKSSPIPTPPRRKGQIEVIIPRNIKDPLNLIDCDDDAEYEQQLCSPIKKGRKKRLKKRRTISTTTEISVSDADITGNPEAKTPEAQSDSAKIPEDVDINITKSKICKELNLQLSPKKDKLKRKSEEHKDVAKKFRYSMDKIVSPVVPQPGAWLKRMNSINKRQLPRQNKPPDEKMPLFKDKNTQFQFGNYNRYYGYRNAQNEVDHRLKVFSIHRYLFEGKDILDIGCNIGHVTLSVARDFCAKTVTGIDIDNKLIGIARKNIKYYVKSVDSPRPDETNTSRSYDKKSSEFFPISMPILYGAIDIPGFEMGQRSRGFPKNVTFKKCNYILDDDTLLALEQPQFDAILCLSVTKWIHLNWGDAGLKQCFRRMYAQLRPGGKLILEPQNWASYKSKRKLTETIFKNYNSIEFFPEKFTEYLLSPAVGFAKSEILGYPQHQSKGFRRPIQVFTKSTMYPSERIEATPNDITPNNPVYSDSVYQGVMRTQKYETHNQHISDSVEYVYSGIVDRYSMCVEDNVEANILIDTNLRKMAEINSRNFKIKEQMDTNDSEKVINRTQTVCEPENRSKDNT